MILFVAISKQLNKNNLIEKQPYFIEDYVLHRINNMKQLWYLGI